MPLLTLSTAVTIFVLGLIFVDAIQIGIEEAMSGNVGIIEPILVLGVSLIVAVSLLVSIGR
jgi:hypothetical protein